LLHGFTLYCVSRFFAYGRLESPPKMDVLIAPIYQARAAAVVALFLGLVGFALLLVGSKNRTQI